ncbi:helix-turn-helix domain-containing protein [Aureimonas flava]|uniref:Helix-turn-helix domain-containing protein n=1 Tax=Aureimonas flava TaxID=2320271 RepID=A0A3A1WL19_9HYPH|nr:helix-turn-helix domain-containing protein [Aureimonas flava]RIY01999.1 helix-turn-helix domain-containing protein [Aureimonas flava]
MSIPVYALYGEAEGGKLPAGVHAETISSRSSHLDWRIAPHRHSHLFQALLVAEGHAMATAEGRRIPLPAPALAWVPPLVVHAYDFAPGTVGTVVSVPANLLRSGLALAPAVLQRLGAFRSVVGDLPAEEWQEARFLCATLLRDYQTVAAGREASLCARAALLALWVHRRTNPRGEDGREDDTPSLVPIVRRFLDAVEGGFGTARSLADYAREAGVSASHLARACRSVTGRSPSRLVQDRRLIEAKRLLAYTALPVAQVAYRLGFEDAAYFSRFFKARVGASPLSFRRIADGTPQE